MTVTTSNGSTIEYLIIDDPRGLRSADWERVVAVFVTGLETFKILSIYCRAFVHNKDETIKSLFWQQKS